MERGEGLPARRDHSVPERFEVALEVGQGRSQLVRCVRDEVRPFAGVRVEPLGHQVEGLGEEDDLLGTLWGNARAQITLRDAPRGATHPQERRGEPASQNDGERQAGDGRAGDGRGQGSAHRLIEHLAGRGDGRAVLLHEPLERGASRQCDARGHDGDRADRYREGAQRDARADPVHETRTR